MNGEYLSRNISGERRAQYGPRGVKGERLDQRADDLRRYLILKYAISPADRDRGLSPRNLWQEEVDDLLDHIGTGEDKIGADSGTSSGYFPELLYESGYRGSLIASDHQTSELHLKLVYDRIQPLTQGADFKVGQADAEDMELIKLLNDGILAIPDDSFDFYVLNNVVHHTPMPERAVAQSVRVTKNGGLVYFMGRGEQHFYNIYKILANTADFYGAKRPIPFYERCDMYALEKIIDNTQGLQLLKKVPQAENIWVPMTDEGWNDYTAALYTHLPHMIGPNGRPLPRREVEEYIEGPLKKSWFQYHGSYTEGYITDYVFQTFFVCQVEK